MNYTYQEILDSMNGISSTQIIVRLPDCASVPNDPENSDWQQYQVWLSEGNQPLPPAGA